MKKILISTAIACTLMGQVSFANQVQPVQNTNTKKQIVFKDLPKDFWAKDSIEKLVKENIISGYGDGTVRPNASITRAEFVVMINKMMGYTEKVKATKFKDVYKDQWYYDAMLIAEKYGYIAGTGDGTFAPNANITREQVCVIISKVMNLVDIPNMNVPKDKVSSWAVPYVNKVLANRIMKLDQNGNFRATKLATRADVADAIAKFVKTRPKTEIPAQDKPVAKPQPGTLAAQAGKLTAIYPRIDVQNSSNLTNEEKDKVIKELLKLNKDKKIKSIKLDDKGNVTEVKFEDNSILKDPKELQSHELVKEPGAAGGGGGGGGGGSSTPAKNSLIGDAENIKDDLRLVRKHLKIKSQNSSLFIDGVESNLSTFINDGDSDRLKRNMETLKNSYSSILSNDEKEDLKTTFKATLPISSTQNMAEYFGISY